LIDVQQQALALQNENQELRDELRCLKRAIEEEKSFQFMHGVYWKTRSVARTDRLDEDGNPMGELLWDGPFCPLCMDAGGKAVRSKSTGQTFRSQPVWECEIHRTDYPAPNMPGQG
jgi:hypothetical protein